MGRSGVRVIKCAIFGMVRAQAKDTGVLWGWGETLPRRILVKIATVVTNTNQMKFVDHKFVEIGHYFWYLIRSISNLQLHENPKFYLYQLYHSPFSYIIIYY